jgi:hypothetical protein
MDHYEHFFMFGWDKQDVYEYSADLVVCVNSERRHGSGRQAGRPCGGPLDTVQNLGNDSDRNIVSVTRGPTNSHLVYQQMDCSDLTKRVLCLSVFTLKSRLS